MEEGTIARWLKSPGDAVRRGDVLAEIETDKAVMDLEAFDDGILSQILLDPGETVPIGQKIAIIGDAVPGAGQPRASEPKRGRGTALSGSSGSGSADASAPASVPAPAPVPATAPVSAATPPTAGASSFAEAAGLGGGSPTAAVGGERPPGVVTSPLARSLARRHSIELSSLAGSGPGGRIVRRDVEEAIARREHGGPKPPVATVTPGSEAVERGSGPRGDLSPGSREALPPTAGTSLGRTSSARGDVEEIPLSSVRRLTAERLGLSATVPTFSLVVVVDAGPLLALRAEINADRAESAAKVSVTDLVIKACGVALADHREVNASFALDKILSYRAVNVGLAVAVPDGLTVPVVRDADEKSVGAIASEARRLAERARAGRLSLDELSGGTFTVSNLGMYGIDHFDAVINPPEAAILAVGAAKREPVVTNGEIAIGTTITATLTVDHRVLDGATAAIFLAQVKDLLEHPLRLLI